MSSVAITAGEIDTADARFKELRRKTCVMLGNKLDVKAVKTNLLMYGIAE